MGKYKIGRDLEKLRQRVDVLVDERSGAHGSQCAHGSMARHGASAGTVPRAKPLAWSLEKHAILPPFAYGLLGIELSLEPGLKFSAPPESKTWPCPDPLVLTVDWTLPYLPPFSEEFYRFKNQNFSIIKIVNPNTGLTTCTATYAAQLVASGKGKSKTWFVPGLGVNASRSELVLTLLGAKGNTLLQLVSGGYSIGCHDNSPFVQSWDFNPGLYDLVAGASWFVQGAQAIDRC